MQPGLGGQGNIADARHITERIPQYQSVIAGVGLCKFREFAVTPVELARVHDHSADRCAVSADILGGRKNRDVRSVFDGSDETDSDRVVNDEGNACIMSNSAQCVKIRHIELGVSYRLGIDGTGPARDGFSERAGISGIYKLCVSSELRESVM